MIKNIESSASGYCRSCGKTHFIGQGRAREYCLDLMERLENMGRIDFEVSVHDANPSLSLDYIKGEAMGQMFGVLECLDKDKNTVILKAFSGQYNGIWDVEGWAPPLLDTKKFYSLAGDADVQIKDMGKMIDRLSDGNERKELIQKRKKISRSLMKEIHGLYRVHNFRPKVMTLFELFVKGIPTGAGDCCAPKLLNAAAKQGLKPLSLAEIFWGRQNRSGTREHGKFYTPCKEKCGPILGFMLCGIDC